MYKIMIVDDEKVEREVIRMFIEKSDLDIDTIIECSSGKEALAKGTQIRPDIILMDINMPGMNGLDALDHMRIANVQAKVIFSTAYGYFEYAQKAVRLGAFDYLLKPVGEERILRTINKAIDTLDSENEQVLQHEKMDQFIRYYGKHIVKELVLGNVNEEVLYYLDTIGIETNINGYCICFKLSHELAEDIGHKLKEKLCRELKLYDMKVLSQIRNQTLTILIFTREIPLEDSMNEWLLNLLKTIVRNSGVEVKKSAGSLFKEINCIESAFLETRTLIGDMEKWSKDKGEHESDEMDTTIRQVKEYIDYSYASKITLDGISKEFGYSKYHLNRIFKQHVGTTIIDYLIGVRIQVAKALLKNGDLSIRRISEKVGYADSNYFTWSFKKVEGVSPEKYRYQSQESDSLF